MSRNVMAHDFGSDEEDDDFNPAPADDSGDEDTKVCSGRGVAHRGRDDDDDDDDDEDDVNTGRTARHRAGSEDDTRGRADDEDEEGENDEEDEEGEEEDEDEEEEEEDDDEDANAGRPRKRRRKAGVHSFFEEEAGVDEDEDEAEDDEDELAEFGGEMHPDDMDALPVGAETDDRRHRQLDRQRELAASMDAEKQAQMLKERYGRNRAAATDAVVVPKRLLLPSVDDPSIWGVRCKAGKEREVVFAIQKRIEERPPGSRNPIKIMSAFERGGAMTGYIYVEARRQADVMEALQDMTNVYPRTKMILVPVREMPDLLRVQKSEELMPGGWVRIKRGKYQGDLAQIEEVETNGLAVTVRLVPRLDYGLNEDIGAPVVDPKRKRPGVNPAVARPPQRAFSEAEAKKKHAKYLSATSGLGGKSWNYLGETYVDGFLIKDLKVQHLIAKSVNPRLEEVTMFARGSEDGTSNLDLASLAETLKNSTAEDSYLPGDPVEVFRGEQQGLIGRTSSTRGDIVTILVTEGDLAGQTIDAPVKSLRKRFREGDHVKVIGGSRYQDELGMVVQVKDDTVTLLSDMSMQEITVFSKDLRLSAETGVDGKLGMFDVHDLVQLDAATVACIVKVDRESLRVLDQNGSIRTILPTQVANKITPRKDAVATDRNGAEIRHGDTVREVYGEQRNGVILHIHRSFLFLHNKAQAENSGIVVVRTTNVVTVSAKGGRATGPDLTKMNPALMRNGAPGNMMGPPQRSFGRDRMIGKTVMVRKGPFKGLVGIVKDSTDVQARVELHSKNKLVSIPKDILVVKDPVTGQTIDMGRGRGGPRVPHGGSGGPPSAWQGGRTPMGAGDSSRTPAWGGASSARTPAWTGLGGSRTPAWKQDGSRTSNPYDGSHTAYGGYGSRTPAWNAGARTPYVGSGNSDFDAFAAGSRTPAWGSANAGNRTPAWSGASASNGTKDRGYDAPTPGGYSAPTPGAYGSAPTPGVSAPTPGAWADSAPTPGAFNAPTPGDASKRPYDAPTPAAFDSGSRPYDAPTPAMGGAAATPGAGAYGDGDDGPRYEEGTPSP
ncbi:transcription elongation factor SPT5 [Aspergillus sclerotioniger CBS 115572]|uniref:Transcription elongation factor SPT5 n=1 Tax=Aspergillus sclerotioniger CBS 115572 TaxID=1450535 RepID=A0A317X4I1_9EURO|nr:transcription elongation factor SPT5 [Aspergillus sclerotioniger CBS 115572]PWY93509.1 transcription elongation factor SPT5 [Aspergillus sclerotioniger CBS 115572]